MLQLSTVLPRIDRNAGRAYGWRSLTVWRVCYVSHLLLECGAISWQEDALDSKSRGGTEMKERTLKIAAVCIALLALILVSSRLGIVHGQQKNAPGE